MKEIFLSLFAFILLASASAFAADWTGQVVKVTGVSDQATKAITLTAVSKV